MGDQSWAAAPVRQTTTCQGVDMDNLVGLRIRVKMAPPLTEEHVGDLFAFDEKMQTIALQTLEANNNNTFTILKQHCIASVECLSSSPNPDVVNVRLPPVDMGRLKQKEYKALDLENKKMDKIGQNVAPVAQEIFDGLSFTLPYSSSRFHFYALTNLIGRCVWAGQCIRLPDLEL